MGLIDDDQPGGSYEVHQGQHPDRNHQCADATLHAWLDGAALNMLRLPLNRSAGWRSVTLLENKQRSAGKPRPPASEKT
jgi:hypothetical protein